MENSCKKDTEYSLRKQQVIIYNSLLQLMSFPNQQLLEHNLHEERKKSSKYKYFSCCNPYHGKASKAK